MKGARLPFACLCTRKLMGATLPHSRILKDARTRDANSAWRLFRSFRHDRTRHAREPAVDEVLQPCALAHVVHRAIGKVQMTRMRAGRIHSYTAARGPAMHHRVGDIGMKLQA